MATSVSSKSFAAPDLSVDDARRIHRALELLHTSVVRASNAKSCIDSVRAALLAEADSIDALIAKFR